MNIFSTTVSTKKRKTVSIEPEQAEWVDERGENLSQLVRNALDARMSASDKSRRERLQEQLEEVREERDEVQDELEALNEEIESIKHTIEQVEKEQEDKFERVLKTLSGERGAVTVGERKREPDNEHIQRLATRAGLSPEDYVDLLDHIGLHYYTQYQDLHEGEEGDYKEGIGTYLYTPDLTEEEEQAAKDWLRGRV